MANTERLAVLRAVRQAKAEVDDARVDDNLQKDDVKTLERLYLQLDRLEDMLILEDLDDRVTALESAGKKLQKINAALRETVKRLKEIAALVEKAANAIKILVDILTKAASLVG